MKNKTRNILLIVGFVLLAFAGLFLYGGYRIYSVLSLADLSGEIPEELKETGVRRGAGFLTRTEFFKLAKEGWLTTAGKGAQQPDEKERRRIIESQTAKGIYGFDDLKVFGDEIVAVGRFGGYVFDTSGVFKREILFEPAAEKIRIAGFETESYRASLDNLRIVALETGRFGFLSHGSLQGARVFDGNGNQIWSYGQEAADLAELWPDEKSYEKSTHVLEAAVGDLDGDGVSEYLVARKNEGLRAFDRQGSEKWLAPDEFPSNKLTVTDVDGDGRNEILEVGASSLIRGADGKVLRELKGGRSDDAVLFTEHAAKKKSLLFCSLDESKFTCEDETKKTLFEGEAPLSEVPKKAPEKIEVPGRPDLSFTSDTERAANEKAVWVRWRRDGPRHLAVVASFIGIPRAQFYVYDEKGALVYHELLPEDAETIAVISAANAGEEILIGGMNTIWKYAAK